MSPRPRATFTKRQKEQARLEKQRAKAARKLQRKLEGRELTQPDEASSNASAMPDDLNSMDGPASEPQQSRELNGESL